MGNCTVDGCNDKAFGHGLCSKHYNRQRRHGSVAKPLTRRGRLVQEGKSYCPKCDSVKPIGEFLTDTHTKYGISIYCAKCHQEKAKVRYRKYPDYYKDADLKAKFGLSLEQYRELEERQDHKCALCHKERGPKRFAVDHDHKTGKNRGLLCDRCNLGLGWFEDSIELLEAAIRYIKAHQDEEKQ